MANEMPRPTEFDGLSRKVIEHSEAFAEIVGKVKQGTLSDADWQPIEQIVNVSVFERLCVFLGPEAEAIDWPKYRYYVSQYAAGTEWEGKLRHITEQGNRVILELQERNTRGGDRQRLCRLEVYVMPLEKR